MAVIDRRGVSVSATDSAIAGDPNPGLAIKAPCLVATTGNIALSSVQTIDGVSVGNNSERVLVWQQTDPTQNGLYNASSGPWTRTKDADGNDDIAAGMLVAVTGGSTYWAEIFRLSGADPLLIGSSALTFSIFTALQAPVSISGSNPNALTVGPNGAVNPTFRVDTSAVNASTGLLVKGAASGSGLALSVLSPAANENLTIDARGAGTITIGSVSSGAIALQRNVSIALNLGVYGNVAIGAALAADTALTINNNTVAGAAPANAGIHIVGADNANAGLTIDVAGSVGPVIAGRGARNTIGAKSAAINGSVLLNLTMQGWDGSAYQNGAAILGIAGETFSGTSRGSYLNFYSTPLGTTVLTNAMRLQPSGGLAVGANSISNDYGIGTIASDGPVYFNGLASNSSGGVPPTNTLVHVSTIAGPSTSVPSGIIYFNLNRDDRYGAYWSFYWMNSDGSSASVLGSRISSTSFDILKIWRNNTAGTSSVIVLSSDAASSTTTGALQVTGGLGVGGAGYFGDIVSAASASGFYLGSNKLAKNLAGYHSFFDPASTGSSALDLGGSDPSNYYSNTTHVFRARSAGATFVTLDSASLRPTVPIIITSAAAAALAVGANGSTNPALQVDASTASSATGVKIKSAAAASGVAVSAISSGANENMTIDAKGTGVLSLGSVSTGGVKITGLSTPVPVVSVAVTYTQLVTDTVLFFNRAGATTVTLLAAASYGGRFLYIVQQNTGTVSSASSNVVPLGGGAAGTAMLAGTIGKWALLHSDGTNWNIIAAN